LSQTPFSLPGKAQDNRFKKTLLLTRKPDSNGWDKGSASDNRWIPSVCVMEGLSFLMLSHLTGMPAHACFFVALTLPSPKMGEGKKESKNRVGRSERCS